MTTSFDDLKKLCRLIRYDIVTSTTTAGSGHPSSSLSAVELMATLFFGGPPAGGFFKYDLNDPKNLANDRFILSKGHASPLLYSLYHAAGAISQSELMTLRKFGSPLEGHPTPDFKYADVATGSLGQGLSVGVGMAIGMKRFAFHPPTSVPKIYVLLGDSEMAEGQNWEAMELGTYYKLNNLVGILDVNRLGQRGETMLSWDLKTYQKRIESFGWKTIMVEDGHNLNEIQKAFGQINQRKSDSPTMIIAKTVKGKGVSFMENKDGWHGKPVPKDMLEKALKDIGDVDMGVRGKIKKPNFQFSISNFQSIFNNQNKDDKKIQNISNKLLLLSQRKKVEDADSFATRDLPAGKAGVRMNEHAHGVEKSRIETHYKLNDLISTREAFGSAITKLGKTFQSLLVLDGEVANSTYTEKFQKEFPERFFQMFIAEQNMVTAAVGISKINLVPLVSTFAAFFTRAFDQLRIASYSRANVKFVGTHAGVFIGADGPSQMGLEDISMMRSINGSVVLYPSDAVSTEKLIEKMLDVQGICYLRATRDKTPVIYKNDEEFKIGGSKIHLLKSKVPPKGRSPSGRKNKILIIAAGVTLHEALKAQKELTEKGVETVVLDCYSVKPLDTQTINKLAKEVKKIIVAEDHFPEGGLGEAVLSGLMNKTVEDRKWKVDNENGRLKIEKNLPSNFVHLSVRKLPRSGTQKELLAYEGIDSQAIIKPL